MKTRFKLQNRETTPLYHISGNHATEVRRDMLSQKAFSCIMYSEKTDFSSEPKNYQT